VVLRWWGGEREMGEWVEGGWLESELGEVGTGMERRG